jgi:outer membrane protein TolC
LEVLKRRLELTKEQFDIGEVTLTDVSIAEARHLLAQSELIESEKNVNTLSAKFNYIFGANPNKPNIILDYKQINLEESLIEKSSQKNNPRLNDIKYQIKSIRNEIEKIKRKRLPTVKLEGEAYINEGYFKFDSKREVLSAFATVDIPLYQSGSASSKIRETRSKLLSQQLLLKKIKDEISYNLISSKSLFDNSLSKIAAYEKQIKSNNIYLDGLKQEMQLGERTMLDLLDGEQELLQSELDLALSFKDLFIAYYQILYHEGKLNAKDLRLSVKHYNVENNFNKVKGKWLDIIE